MAKRANCSTAHKRKTNTRITWSRITWWLLIMPATTACFMHLGMIGVLKMQLSTARVVESARFSAKATRYQTLIISD